MAASSELPRRDTHLLLPAVMLTGRSPCVRVRVQISPFYEDLGRTGSGALLLQDDLVLADFVCNDPRPHF